MRELLALWYMDKRAAFCYDKGAERIFHQNRLSEFSGSRIRHWAGRHLEKRGNGPKGVQESSVICGPEILRGYQNQKEEEQNMSTIGETIATLRKRQGMTQEALAGIIGVSPQSVSKWEGNVNMPDISLLPVLADIFRCRIDDLFGRGDIMRKSAPDKVLDRCCGAVAEELGACSFRDIDRWEDYDRAMAEYRRGLKEDDHMRSAVMEGHGIAYYREKLGALLLRKPQEGWQELFKQEGLDEVLNLVGDEEFRKALEEICRSRLTFFTLRTLRSRCGIQEEASLKEKLEKSKLFWVKTIDVDGSQVTTYELTQIGKLSMLLAVLSFAAEYAEYKDNYVGFFMGGVKGLIE